MEQFVLFPSSVYIKNLTSQSVTKQEIPKYQPSQNPTYQNDSFKEKINRKLPSKAESLVDKILSCLHIKLSKLQTLILDGAHTGTFLLGFGQQLRRKNADGTDPYFNLFDAAGLSANLNLKQNANAKERGSWVPSKNWKSGPAKAVDREWCCLWVCVQLSEN